MRNETRLSLRGSAKDALTHVKKMLDKSSGVKLAPRDTYTSTYPITLNTHEEASDFVRESIRLYMESWVVPPLIRVNEKVNKNKE